MQTLEELKQIAANCRKCKLHTTRTEVVFGEGNPNADIFFIGEGPGQQEDLTGRPFVGRAGELLTRLIEKGMGLERSEVYIANITKCRPTVDLQLKKDRPPDREEVEACSPYLLKQIELVSPKVLVTLGNPSTRFILNTTEGITTLRGKWAHYKDIPVMPTYHPSYVLRNGGENSNIQKEVWGDLLLVLERLGRSPKIKITWKS